MGKAYAVVIGFVLTLVGIIGFVKGHAGSRTEMRMASPVVHFEIGCRDRKITEEFYAKSFEWKIESTPNAGMIEAAASGIAGHITSLGHEPHHYTIFYVQVEDLKASLERAASLGGKTLVPPIEIPGYGSFAWMADPDGNTVGLWKPAK